LTLKSSTFTPPSLKSLDKRLRVQRWYFAPRLRGSENVDPQRPSLFVGNHGLYGLIDSPLFVAELYRETGVYPRALGDHFHFQIPGWGPLLERFGAVDGTPENCQALMESGQHILVFPGGGREVAMRKGEEHRLVWKQRTGFARMAIAHGYDIIPFASAGCDYTYDVLFDGEAFKTSRLGQRVLKNGRVNNILRDGDLFMPLGRGVGPTLVPRPEPFWFQIGKPIRTDRWAGRAGDKDACWELREEVASSIECMLAELEHDRADARHKGWRKWFIKD